MLFVLLARAVVEMQEEAEGENDLDNEDDKSYEADYRYAFDLHHERCQDSRGFFLQKVVALISMHVRHTRVSNAML
jgi:hypothetical protein